jgi:sec-independent protein translocase protein TatA
MSIGPAEIIIVLVIALLVFGPSRLPQMGRSLGRGVREFKKAADTAKNELGLGEVTDSINEVKSTFTEPLKEVTGTFTEPLKEVTDTFSDLKASVDVKSAVEAPLATAGVVAAAEESPETPDVTPATVFADVTPATVFADVTPPATPETPAQTPAAGVAAGVAGADDATPAAES